MDTLLEFLDAFCDVCEGIEDPLGKPDLYHNIVSALVAQTGFAPAYIERAVALLYEGEQRKRQTWDYTKPAHWRPV